MSVSKRLRYEVLRRDNHTCRYCGASAPDVELHVDHVVPSSLGGPDEPSNLVASCEACNAGKSSVSADDGIVEDVREDALRWSNALRRAAEIERSRREEINDQVDLIGLHYRMAWQDMMYIVKNEPGWYYNRDPDNKYDFVVELVDKDTGEILGRQLFDTEDDAQDWVAEARWSKVPPMPKGWRNTARSWLAAGLTTDDFKEIANDVAQSRGYVQWDHKWRYLAGACWNAVRQRQAVAQALLAAESADADAGLH